MISTAITTAADLVKQYDRPSRTWWSLGLVKRTNGSISLKETGLQMREPNPEAPFVKQLSGLSDSEFALATKSMDEAAIKAYLYNKYQAFFAKWDSGLTRGFSGTQEPGPRRFFYESSKLDGLIDGPEYDAGGGDEAFIADYKTMITSRRDGELLFSGVLIFELPGLGGGDPVKQSLLWEKIKRSENAGTMNSGDATKRTPELPPKNKFV